MSNDSGGTGPLPRGPGKDPEFQHVIVQWTGPERSIAIAASIILVVNLLIGDILLNDFSVSNSTWLISLAALSAMYFFYAGEQNPWHDFYPWLAEMAGWAIALIGGLHVIERYFRQLPELRRVADLPDHLLHRGGLRRRRSLPDANPDLEARPKIEPQGSP